MFNIANIRSGILQKLGVSTQNEKTAETASLDSVPQPSSSEKEMVTLTNPNASNSKIDDGSTVQNRLTTATNVQPCNRDCVSGDTEMNEDDASSDINSSDKESAPGQVKVVLEESKVYRELSKSDLPSNETGDSLNGFNVTNSDTNKTPGLVENGTVTSPCVVTGGVLSSTNRMCSPSRCSSAQGSGCETLTDRPVPVVFASGSQSDMITDSHSQKEDTLTQQQRDTANLETDIVIKTEKFDEGYERHSAVAAPSSFAEISENLDGFDNVFVPKKERVDDEGDPDDVVILGVGYRNPYSDSDSSDSESSISSFETDYTNRRGSPSHEHEDIYEDPRTKGELFPEDLPPLEDLQISISDQTRMVQIGEVTGIVDILVVIKSTLVLDGHVLPVNEDTVFFFENRKPFGKVFEVFGPTRSPFYSVRFNAREDIVNKGVEVGLKVFFVPEPEPELEDITHYVFVDSLLKIKGSDASWQDNNEPPTNMLDYSDDEEERRAKSKRKGKKKQGEEDDGDVAKTKKGNNSNNTNGEGASSDASQRKYKRPTNSNRGRGGFSSGFSGPRPRFTGPSGLNTRMDSPRQSAFPELRNRMECSRPPVFSGPNVRNSQQLPPVFSGPNDRMPFQPRPVFPGPSNGMNSQAPPPMFSGPVDGMLPPRPPMFPCPPTGVNSQRPPPAMISSPPSGMNSQPPPPVFSGSANGMMTSPPPPLPPPMFAGAASRMNSHPPFNFSGPPNNIPPPPLPSMFSAPSHQPHQFGCWVPPQPSPAFTGTQGNPDQETPQWGYHN